MAAKKKTGKKGASRKKGASAKAAKKTSRKKAAKKKAKKAGQAKASKKKAAKKKATKKKARKAKAAKKKAAGKKAKKKAPKKTAEASAPTDADEAEAADAEGEDEAPAPRPIPRMPARRKDGVITIAASPDADDAFMFYGLWSEKVDTEGRRYEIVQDDIEVLNKKAAKGTYDVTAISFGAYPHIADRYDLLTCGASFADGRGPVMVARKPIRTNEVNGLKVAVPGEHTTVALVLQLWLPHAGVELVPVPFDRVLHALAGGRARAGILIHEAQLTWRQLNLVPVVDFGQWWAETTEGLPLPLGANAIRRDIDEEERKAIGLDIKRSIAYGLGHREETVEWAMKFAKGLPKQLVDQYVGMYVNELSLDLAIRGKQAVQHLYDEALRWKLLEERVRPVYA